MYTYLLLIDRSFEVVFFGTHFYIFCNVTELLIHSFISVQKKKKKKCRNRCKHLLIMLFLIFVSLQFSPKGTAKTDHHSLIIQLNRAHLCYVNFTGRLNVSVAYLQLVLIIHGWLVRLVQHKVVSGEVLAWTEVLGGGGRGELYLTSHCHHQNDFCIRMGGGVAHFDVLIWRGSGVGMGVGGWGQTVTIKCP